ncbi:hypothetical protein EU528_06380 [Candidatus Thorarchaeota archaeon]|nr:MAG: hypothetical protein EU528_06380 [Candidatus Thorarchaeota archaeon]
MNDTLKYITSDGIHREKELDNHSSTIDLSNLDIRHFDTSQLASNQSLRKLRLNGNNIERLDITPLITCKKLGTLILDGETDAETILSYETMNDIAKEVLLDAVETYDALTFLPSLNSIRASYEYVRNDEPDWKVIHLFQNALRVIDCGWMGMLDIGMKESKLILKQLLDSGNSPEIKDRLISLLVDKINHNHPTIDLDIQMMKHYGDLVMLIDDVVEQRTAEMKNQYVPVMTFPIDKASILLLESVGESVDTHYADLRMLWLTSYGFEVLESLSMGTTCEMREFSKINEALSSLGFEIKTNLDSRVYPIIGWRNRKVLEGQGIESPEPEIKLPKQLSSEMVEYIWQLAEFRSNASMTLVAATSDEPIRIDLSKLE